MRNLFLMTLFIALTLTVNAQARVSVSADAFACERGRSYTSVRVTVNNTYMNYYPSCDGYFSESFSTREHDRCRVSSMMCRGSSTARIEVRCRQSGSGSTTIYCPRQK